MFSLFLLSFILRYFVLLNQKTKYKWIRMRQIFYSKQARIWIDILLFISIIILNIFDDVEQLWKSFHCIFGSFFLLLMIIHIAQNWKLIKLFTKTRVILRNKITALTIFSFIFIFLSVLLLLAGNKTPFLKIHHIIGELFTLITLIHIIDKFKRFKSLFKKVLS